MREKWEIAVGDVVQLKSGGPLMTVESVSSVGNIYNCVWLSDQCQPVRGNFPYAVLTKDEDR